MIGRRVSRVAALWITLATAACTRLVDDRPEEVGPPDLPGQDQGAAELPDTVEAEAIEACPGALRCPCEQGSDCDSSLCLDSLEGMVCSTLCGLGQSCLPGWHCLEVSTGFDPIHGCVPAAPSLCRPCISDQDCAPKAGAPEGLWVCISHGDDGSFCGAPCQEDRDCPDQPVAFRCDAIPLAAGGTVRQCVPASGQCPCTDKFRTALFETICQIRNEHGVCPGRRTCDEACQGTAPEAETCNGLDDDCDGETDEDLPPLPCEIQNAYGACPGRRPCLSGSLGPCDAPTPALEACNGLDDNCDGRTDEEFPDRDRDGIADCVDPDIDGDGILNDGDRCPYDPDPDQADNDGDGPGDACDDDDDNDGTPDPADLCPRVPDPPDGTPGDADGDGLGDRCDCDADDDGWSNPGLTDFAGTPCSLTSPARDNCPRVSNPDQQDTDRDGTGDACDCDVDADGIPNNNPGCPEVQTPDNCRQVPNPDQADGDGDRIGDACDCDLDNDGVQNPNPGCPEPLPADDCPLVSNPDQQDTDGDGDGDACDCDADGDGVPNPAPGCPDPGPLGDNCPLVFNPDQRNTSGGPFGDACNPDLDDDGVPVDQDNCPAVPNPDQRDADGDGQGDACDCDGDGDGFGNLGLDLDGRPCPTPPILDNCPRIANRDQADLDRDGIGDACDCDVDGDGDPQPNFECPTPIPADCDPFDPEVAHLAPERCRNGVDDNCNGVVDEPGCVE
ncbi:MAG TPA: thrombospondin type 3 repeat-containing protein [Myxococcota bacterium]|nr:thrombospondin type 3 repeat-containing protein [Myxococcota bacterium]HQK52059.1 thrombospondin type 3 repeat-containing protein [Myxococcota bacterium]